MPGVVRKVTTVTSEEGTDVARETCSNNLFEFFDSKKAGEDWDIGYLYRSEPKISGQEGYLMKFTEPISLDFVRERFGGHLFRVLLKKGPQRVCEGKMAIEAPPIMQTDNSNYNQRLSSPSSSSGGANNGDIARHAMDLVADPAKASIGIAMQTAQTGFDIVRAQMANSISANQITLRDVIELLRAERATAVAPAASEMPPWLQQTLAAAVPALITGLVSKLVTPENPIETFKNLAGALQSMPGFGGKGGSDWKASLVESIPQLAQAGTQMMHEWRVATEAAASTHRLPPAPALAMPTPTSVVQNPNAPAAAPGAPPPQPGGGIPPPPEQWLKMKMVEMFRAGRTGEDVGIFLEEIAPAFIEQLAPVPPDQLQAFLRVDPIFAPVADNPRMLEFLQQLHTWCNETDPATEMAAEAVATQKPA